MRIVILGTAHPYRGGIAALNERLAQELVRQKHEVEIYNFSLQYPGFLFPGKTQFTSDPAPKELVIKRKISSVNPFNWLNVGRELKKAAPDLLIVRYWLPFMGPSLGTIIKMVRKNRHTRVVCIADNIIPHEKRPGDKLFTKYFTKGVDGYIAMSHEVFADIEKFVKNPLRRFSPHPVYDHYGEIVSREEALKALQLDPQYRYLLFFGFIRDYKGLDWLLQSLADERLSRLPLRLIVAGEFYSDNGPYLRLIKELGIQEKVVLKADYIPNDQINNYFCAADLLVQPYKTATQSGVTQIGYHFHKAMLVTDVGGLGEIIAHQKSGYVVKPEISAIADAIVDFYKHDRQLPFETETIRMKEQFSWSHMTDVLMDLLHEINKSKG